AVGTWIRLVLQVEQADMPEGSRTKPADLQVVLHQGQPFAQLMNQRAEETTLIIKTGSPSQNTTDIQTLAVDLPEHVARCDALGGAGVMRATRSMNMMVAAEVAIIRRVKPSLQPELE